MPIAVGREPGEACGISADFSNPKSPRVLVLIRQSISGHGYVTLTAEQVVALEATLEELLILAAELAAEQRREKKMTYTAEELRNAIEAFAESSGDNVSPEAIKILKDSLQGMVPQTRGTVSAGGTFYAFYHEDHSAQVLDLWESRRSEVSP